MLTDILVASTEDIPAILSGESANWPILKFKALDNMVLAGLWSALGGTTATEFEGEKHPRAHTQERWVFEFPEDFVRRLSTAQSEAIPGISAVWAQHDEMVHMGADGPAIEPVVEALTKFAREATSQGKRLFLSMSL
ncbi:Uncharacterised protein [Achromobacter spanius]|uniref:hypothetical protein n=1 Tax=Achromobacter spanius TaxID=217203 RepID=UPI000C2CAE86|nr:hypothetical protein [Achromobacter spanius]AUA59072.1 hypothetical protein CVS48_25520 [Achromobacter spanius]CAB3660701.1 hypothetical protein LMG5911_02944 [Achromobacter spanius]SPT40493.1 Uncharacterised protein [Achromobacter denitrificans]VEE58750.1 Uncharacterised protein [Achromobacter spanius]